MRGETLFRTADDKGEGTRYRRQPVPSSRTEGYRRHGAGNRFGACQTADIRCCRVDHGLDLREIDGAASGFSTCSSRPISVAPEPANQTDSDHEKSACDG